MANYKETSGFTLVQNGANVLLCVEMDGLVEIATNHDVHTFNTEQDMLTYVSDNGLTMPETLDEVEL